MKVIQCRFFHYLTMYKVSVSTDTPCFIIYQFKSSYKKNKFQLIYIIEENKNSCNFSFHQEVFYVLLSHNSCQYMYNESGCKSLIVTNKLAHLLCPIPHHIFLDCKKFLYWERTQSHWSNFISYVKLYFSVQFPVIMVILFTFF